MGSKNLDGKLVKTAHSTQKFTEQNIDDLMKCQDLVNGPHYFLDNFFYIQHPVKGKLRYEAFEYQRRLIDSYHQHRFNVNLLPRQTGKTTTAAGYLLWYAMFMPDSTILIAAHKYTGAQEIMNRIRYAYELCPDHIRCGVTSYNKQSIEFDNGSRIVAQTTTETTGRGMSLSMLYADEFAFVAPNIASEFWTSISPTLATGGKAIITSTPNSDEDQFAQIWHEANKRFDEFGNQQETGKNGFFPFKAHWTEHPERDEKWADIERSRIGEERFRREHECEFLIFDETLINSIALSDMEGTEPIMKMGQVRWYKKIDPKCTYIVALDPSLGTGGDPAAIQIFEADTTTQIGEWKHNKTSIPGQVKLLADINRYISDLTGEPNNIYYSLENNSIGEAAIISLHEYGEQNIPGIFLSESGKKRKGFNTTHKVKLAACAKFKTLLESKKMKINSRALISELKSFIASGGSYAAKSGETDDLVMSSLLTVRMLQQLSDYHMTLETQMRDHDEFMSPLPFFAVIA